jgi:hypothetical protein
MAKFVVKPDSVVIEDTEDGRMRVRIIVGKESSLTIVGTVEKMSMPGMPLGTPRPANFKVTDR